MIKAITFDFDMTLIDSLTAGNKAIEDMKTEIGLLTKGMTAKQLWGMNHLDFIKKIIEINDSNIKVKELSEFNKKSMIKHYINCELYDIETLKKLKDKKLKLGIISNNSSFVINKVLNNEYNKKIKFDFIMGIEDESSKTNLLNKLLKKLNLQPKQMAYVGDHPNDIIAAKQAGVVAIGVTTGLHTKEELEKEGAIFVLRSLKELENIV